MIERPSHIVCAYCERTIRVNRDGKVRKHKHPATGKPCRGSGRDEAGFHRTPEPEAPLLCAECAPSHVLGQLRKPCGLTGCQCWCNR